MNPSLAKELSIIVPFYNGSTYIARALESIVGQTFLPDTYEIILVNDASIEYGILQFLKELETNSINLTVYNLTENKGPSFARNYGIKKSSGKYIAFLDCDDVWPAYKLAHQMQHLYQTGNDISGGAVQYYCEPGIEPALNFRYGHQIIYHVHLGAVIAKRAIFDAKNLWFNENQRFSEDFD